ncbi:MAG: hypothetical protein Q7S10_00275 [bacterium]|nr:hypothetical protein [bacterium]
MSWEAILDLEWKDWIFVALGIGFLISIGVTGVLQVREFRRLKKEEVEIAKTPPLITILQMDKNGNFIIRDALLAELAAKEKNLGKALEILSETMRRNASTSPPESSAPLVI